MIFCKYKQINLKVFCIFARHRLYFCEMKKWYVILLLFALAACNKKVEDTLPLEKQLHRSAILQLCEKGQLTLEDEAGYLLETSSDTLTVRELLAGDDFSTLDSIVLKISGKSFPEYAAENLFGPAQMTDSNYDEQGILHTREKDVEKWNEAVNSLKILSPLGTRRLQELWKSE